jgi:hypothetical protein
MSQETLEERVRSLERDNAVLKSQMRFLGAIGTIALGVGVVTLITVLLKA